MIGRIISLSLSTVLAVANFSVPAYAADDDFFYALEKEEYEQEYSVVSLFSKGAHEYYMTGDMLLAIGVIDGELYNAVQVFIP